MKGMRKGLSLVMAFLLALSLLPVSPFTMPAWAGTGSTATGSDAELEDGNVLPVSTAADAEETSLKDAALLPAAFEKSTVIDGVKITVSAAPGVFPDGAQLKVQKVDLPEVDAAVESERDANASVKQKYTFDIKIFNKAGNEIESDEEYGKASVTFTLADVPEEYDSISVYHVKGEESGLTAEKLDTEVSGEGGSGKVSASVKTDSFSPYVIELETLAGAAENTVVGNVSNATLTGKFGEDGSPVWTGKLKADEGYLLPYASGITVISDSGRSYYWSSNETDFGFTYVLSNDLSTATITIYGVRGTVTVSDSTVINHNGDCWYIVGNVLHIGTLSSDIPRTASYSGTFSGGGYNGINLPPWYQYGSSITEVIVDKTCILPSSTVLWFSDFTNMTSCNVSNLDTSNVTYMDSMFQGCSKLHSLDLSKFDTSNVTDMHSMFSVCSGLQSFDLSSFNTSNVTNMFSMFFGCNDLQSINLSKFDTSKVTKMGRMFYGCSNLQSLDISNFDTSKVTNMSYMFSGCSSLNSVTFGPNFAFKGNDAVLPTPKGTGYTGNWIKIGGTAYTPADLATLTGAALQGTWVAEFAVVANANTGTGSGGAEWTNGWSRDGKRYQVNGAYAANIWVKVGDSWYHFNSKGYMQTGWVLENGKWYYLDPTTGVMAAGLVTADGYNYYFNADGSMAVGDVVINGVTHHFNDTKPTNPTYVFDQETETYKLIEGNTQTPYGAETTA